MGELQKKCDILMNNNNNLKLEIDRITDELNQVNGKNKEVLQVQEDRLQNHESLIQDLEQRHKKTVERIISENGIRIKEITTDWELQCRKLEEKLRNIEKENGDLKAENKRVNDNAVHQKILKEEELNDLKDRIQEAEYQKYQVS